MYAGDMNSKDYDNEKLKQAREAAGLTQWQVAELLNVHELTVSRAECGTSAGYKLLKGMCEIYGISIKEILHDNAVFANAA